MNFIFKIFYISIFISGIFTLNSSLFLSIILLIFSILFLKKNLKLNSFIFFIFLILFLIITIVVFNQKYFQLQNIYKILTAYTLLILFIVLSSYKKTELLLFLKNIFFINFFLSVILSALIILFYNQFNRIYFNFSNSNITSSLISIGLLSGFYIFTQTKNSLYRKVIVCSALIIFGTLFILKSKGALLSLILVVLYYSIKNIKSVICNKSILLGILLILILFSIPIIIKLLNDADAYTYHRLDIWLNSFKIINENLLLGVSNFENSSAQFPIKIFDGFFYYAKSPESPHNGYLYIFTNLGIIIFGLLIYLLVISFKNCDKLNSRALTLKMIIIFIFIHSIVEMNLTLICQSFLIIYFLAIYLSTGKYFFNIKSIYIKISICFIFILFFYLKFSDIIIVKANESEQNQQYELAQKYYKINSYLNPLDSIGFQKSGELKIKLYNKNYNISFLNEGLKNLELSFALEPNNSFLAFNTANFYYHFTNNKASYNIIRYYLDKSIEFNPVYIPALFLYSINEEKKSVKHTELLLNKILKLEPNLPAPKIFLAEITDDIRKKNYLIERATNEYILSTKLYRLKINSMTYPLNYINENIYYLLAELQSKNKMK